MSAVFGVFRRDGGPVDRELLSRMSAALAHWGIDGGGLRSKGPVGFGHHMLRTTPESLHETQPLADEGQGLCLTLDGRIDNREDLRHQVVASGSHLRDDTDAELVLRAYALWGTDCARRLLGDFAFALWDERSRLLYCARDPFGIRPLYYYLSNQIFLFASEPQALFACAAVHLAPNLGLLGELLAGAWHDLEETLVTGVLRLPRAHWIAVGGDAARRARYWDVDPLHEVRHRTDDEYAEHFQALFRDAVRSRLRSRGRVGIQLSGGVDSSSVACLAQSLVRQGAAPDAALETFTLSFEDPDADESEYLQEVSAILEVRSNVLAGAGPGPESFDRVVERHRDWPDYPGGLAWHPLKQLARERGCQVMLTGLGGDEWFVGSWLHYADLLRDWRLGDLVRQARSDARIAGVTGSISPRSLKVLRFGIWPLVPEPIRRTWRAVRRRRATPAWVKPAFAAEHTAGGSPEATGPHPGVSQPRPVGPVPTGPAPIRSARLRAGEPIVRTCSAWSTGTLCTIVGSASSGSACRSTSAGETARPSSYCEEPCVVCCPSACDSGRARRTSADPTQTRSRLARSAAPWLGSSLWPKGGSSWMSFPECSPGWQRPGGGAMASTAST